MFDVITIGTATRDVFLRSSDFKVLKDKAHLEKIGFTTGEAECFALGAKLEIEKPIMTVGGGAANAAVTFARQGLNTAAFFRVGDDEAGVSIVEGIKNEGVTPFAFKDKKDGTAHSTILLTKGGERTILVYRGASDHFQAREIPFQKLKAKWAYIVPGTISISLMSQILSHLKKNGTKIVMNPSRHYLEMGIRKLSPIFQELDAVILNREEGSRLTGVKYENIKGIFKKFDGVVSGIAVLTDGPNGVWVSDGNYFYRAGAFQVKALDETGAGDAFGSGFIAGFIQKNDVNYALRLAAANAASTVEYIGAQDGILRKKDFSEKRWHYLDLDVEPI